MITETVIVKEDIIIPKGTEIKGLYPYDSFIRYEIIVKKDTQIVKSENGYINITKDLAGNTYAIPYPWHPLVLKVILQKASEQGAEKIITET